MSLRARLLLLALLAALAPASAGGAVVQRVELMPGVTYTREAKEIRGRQVVLHIVTAPRPGGLYRLAPVLSNGAVTGTETVSAMQERLSGGATLVGVNGDLFNWDLGYPTGIFLEGGVLAGKPTSGRSTLGIGSDGTLRLARVAFSGAWGIGEGGRLALAQLNRPLGGSSAGLFTPAWGDATPAARGVVDVVVSGFPAAIPNADLTGQVVEVRRGGGTAIPEGGAVLQTTAAVGRRLALAAEAGSPFVAQLLLKPWWDGVADAIGGGPALVRHGRVALPTDEQFTRDQLVPRHPRTAVGQLADGRILLVAVDGRSARSAGVTLWDLAKELQARGAVTAMAFDAGGSTTLAFDGRVLNTPSDGAERAVSDALMVLYYGAYAPEPLHSVVSPNGDGVAETQRLSYKVVRPSTVKARLVGPGGKVVWKEEGEQQPGTYPLEPDVEELAEGEWRWLVTAVDADGNPSSAERRFRVNETLGFLELSARRLTLTRKRGGTLELSFEVAHEARVRVNVEDALGNGVRSLFGSLFQAPGEVVLRWNGRNGRGKVVPGGVYTIRVRATNALGTVELTETVTVKRAKKPR